MQWTVNLMLCYIVITLPPTLTSARLFLCTNNKHAAADPIYLSAHNRTFIYYTFMIPCRVESLSTIVPIVLSLHAPKYHHYVTFLHYQSSGSCYRQSRQMNIEHQAESTALPPNPVHYLHVMTFKQKMIM